MSSTISVQLDALEALAADLRVMAGDLAEDADRCSSAAGALRAGLSRNEGLDAIWAASTWAVLARTVADGTRAVAVVLAASVAAYRAREEARAVAIGRLGLGSDPVFR